MTLAIRRKILELCRLKGIGVSALEEELNLSKAAISKWERSYPRVDSLKKVADYFGVTVDYLISDDETYVAETLTEAERMEKLKREKNAKKAYALLMNMSPEMQKTAIYQLKALTDFLEKQK